MSKTPGWVTIDPPLPPPLYHGRGINLRVRPSVNCDKAVSCAKKKKRKKKERNFKALGREEGGGGGGGGEKTLLLYLSTQLNDASFDSW